MRTIHNWIDSLVWWNTNQKSGLIPSALCVILINWGQILFALAVCVRVHASVCVCNCDCVSAAPLLSNIASSILYILFADLYVSKGYTITEVLIAWSFI
jgi:hypothetical protein